MPVRQGLQEEAPADEYEPAKQLIHVEDETAAKVVE